MMRILLCCAGGFSTNMLMQNMAKVVKDSHKLNEDDFKFDAIPVDGLEEEIDNYDIVLVGPQIGHKTGYIGEIQIHGTFHLLSLIRMCMAKWMVPRL